MTVCVYVCVSKCAATRACTCLEGSGLISFFFLKAQSVILFIYFFLKRKQNISGNEAGFLFWAPRVPGGSRNCYHWLCYQRPMSSESLCLWVFYLSPQGEPTLPLFLWVAVMFIRLMSLVLMLMLKWLSHSRPLPRVPPHLWIICLLQAPSFHVSLICR